MGIHSQKCLCVKCRCLMSGWDMVCLHETVGSDVLRVHELKEPQSKQVTSEPTSFYYSYLRVRKIPAHSFPSLNLHTFIALM